MGWSIYFLTAVLISAALAFSVGVFQEKSGLTFVKRFGGMAIVVPLLVIVLVSSEIELTLVMQGLVFGLIAILIFGIIDDITNLSWKYQLLFQVLLASVLIIFFSFSVDYFVGPFEEVVRIDKLLLEVGGSSFSILSSIFVLAWFLVIINAVNWADGINGLSGGIGMLGGVALFWISLAQNVNQPAIAILALIFIGAILGFWWNNFPQGKIEAGTSGSYAIGFFLAATAIMAGTKIATVLIVLVIPLVDFVWVMYERWQNKLPITKKDKRHLHYKLREYGWSDSKTVVYYFAFIATTLCLAFLMEARNWKFGVILLEIVFLMFFIRNISLKLAKKQKNEIKN